MSTTTIDYDQLNEGAQLLYDAALEKGRQEGRDEQSHESADWQARGALDLAEKMLRAASETGPDRQGDQTARLLTAYAKLLLSRTPLIYVDRPLNMLKSMAWLNNPFGQEPSRVDIQACADACKLALSRRGGYPH